MKYTAVIRTLGKAGDAYQKTLDSILSQTILPDAIIVYIAHGYPIPKETVGCEQYVYVPKGMVAQRALDYDEVTTEYCLFLDDDVYLPDDAVEKLYGEMVEADAQVISPCTFQNHKAPSATKVRLTILGKEVCRFWPSNWAFKVLPTAGFSYNNHPTARFYQSQSNAGPCFLCKKEDFLSISFHEEMWLDNTFYALPDDQIMFYKMYRKGLRVLTSFDSNIVHLDASSTILDKEEKLLKLIYSEYRNKIIFWHRFIYLPECNCWKKIWAICCISYVYIVQVMKSVIRNLQGRKGEAKAFLDGFRSGLRYIGSEEYKSLPLV